MKVFILESWKENDSEIEGVFSTRCLAEAHELWCVNSGEAYADCSFYISEELVDEMVSLT